MTAPTARLLPALLTLLALACDGPADPAPGDARDERFLLGKADAGGIVAGSVDARAVLRLVNEADRDELLFATGLDALDSGERAVDSILAYRLGDDMQASTADDETFDNLAELDAVPFVGPAAFERLRDYAAEFGPPVEGAVYVPLLPSGGVDQGGWTRDSMNMSGWRHLSSWARRASYDVELDLDGSNPGESFATLRLSPTYHVSDWPAEDVVEGSAMLAADGTTSIDTQWETIERLGGLPGSCVYYTSQQSCFRERRTVHRLRAGVQLQPDGTSSITGLVYSTREYPREVSTSSGSVLDPPTTSGGFQVSAGGTLSIGLGT